MLDIASLTPIIQQCAKHTASSTMLAIIKTESGGNKFALGLNKGFKLKYQPRNEQEAISWVNYLEQNNYNFDIGLGQININNLHKYGYKAKDGLDPCINLQLAEKILGDNYTNAKKSSRTEQEALAKAISAYNTGNFAGGFKNGYVARVYAKAGVTNSSMPPIISTNTVTNKIPVARVIAQNSKTNPEINNHVFKASNSTTIAYDAPNIY